MCDQTSLVCMAEVPLRGRGYTPPLELVSAGQAATMKLNGGSKRRFPFVLGVSATPTGTEPTMSQVRGSKVALRMQVGGRS
jgi:hypothetical protein